MKLLRELNSELNRLFLFELSDKSTVEAVFYRGDTLCVSTQVGCALDCPFCLSGSKGLIRNLTAEEIVGQYTILRNRLLIRKIAIAGIGEPLMNWSNVKKAFWCFKSFGLGVSFYTTGHPTNKLRELIQLPHRGVTISLHSVREKTRKKLIPKAGSLEELLNTLREVLSKLTTRKKKSISLAYLLLRGINDSEDDIKAFAQLVRDLGVSATLLRYNQTVEDYTDIEDDDYERLFLLLRSYGIRVTLSTRFRRERLGGCGTLAVNRTFTEY